MDNFIYCIREQALCENESVYFKIGHANDLDRRKSSMQTANPRSLRTVFVLGPFLDRDEAEDVESQAHSLLSKYRVRGEWFDVNPLEIPEFWSWIDAQILPIYVYEKDDFPWRRVQQQHGHGQQEQRCGQENGHPIRRRKPNQGSFDLS